MGGAQAARPAARTTALAVLASRRAGASRRQRPAAAPPYSRTTGTGRPARTGAVPLPPCSSVPGASPASSTRTRRPACARCRWRPAGDAGTHHQHRSGLATVGEGPVPLGSGGPAWGGSGEAGAAGRSVGADIAGRQVVAGGSGRWWPVGKQDGRARSAPAGVRQSCGNAARLPTRFPLRFRPGLPAVHVGLPRAAAPQRGGSPPARSDPNRCPPPLLPPSPPGAASPRNHVPASPSMPSRMPPHGCWPGRSTRTARRRPPTVSPSSPACRSARSTSISRTAMPSCGRWSSRTRGRAGGLDELVAQGAQALAGRNDGPPCGDAAGRDARCCGPMWRPTCAASAAKARQDGRWRGWRGATIGRRMRWSRCARPGNASPPSCRRSRCRACACRDRQMYDADAGAVRRRARLAGAFSLLGTAAFEAELVRLCWAMLWDGATAPETAPAGHGLPGPRPCSVQRDARVLHHLVPALDLARQVLAVGFRRRAGARPLRGRLARSSGEASAFITAALSRCTTSAGVCAGTSMPCRAPTSKPGIAASPTVGTSGSWELRALLVTAGP